MTGASPSLRLVRRNALPVLLVLAASAVVALGATGGLLLPPVLLDEGWTRMVRMAGACAAAAGGIGLLAHRRRLLSLGEVRPDPTLTALFTAAALMAVLAFASRFAPVEGFQAASGHGGQGVIPGSGTDGASEPPRDRPRPPGNGTGDGGPPGGRDGWSMDGTPLPQIELGGSDRADRLFDWSFLGRWSRVLLWLLLGALVVVAVLTSVGRLAGPRPREGTGPPPPETVGPDEGLMALLEDLPEGADTRARITHAYRRLLVALSTAGAPRRSEEAPHEYLHRVLGPLGVQPEALHRLTALYVEAQFGERPMTKEDRTHASVALDASLSDLGARDPRREAVGAGPLLAGAGA